MLDGWIKLHRQIVSHQIWLSEKFTDGQAWIDLLLLANHKDGLIKKRGIRVVVPRGYIGWSERNLAKRWKWSRGKIRRYLSYLVAQNMVNICFKNDSKMDTELVPQTIPQNKNITTLIQIINYESYQEIGPQTVPQTVPQTGHRRYQNKNDKKEKNKTYTDEFLVFWGAYPKKVGKDAAWKAWNGRDGDRPEIDFVLEALNQQLSSDQWTKEHGQYIPNPATWLNQGRWADEIEIPKQKGLW